MVEGKYVDRRKNYMLKEWIETKFGWVGFIEFLDRPSPTVPTLPQDTPPPLQLFKGLFFTICINVVLEIALYLTGIMCLMRSSMLTLLVHLRIDWIVLGVIEHVTMVLCRLDWYRESNVNVRVFKMFDVFIAVCHKMMRI